MFGEDLVSQEEKVDFIYLAAMRNIRRLAVSGTHRILNKSRRGNPSPVLAIIDEDYDGVCLPRSVSSKYVDQLPLGKLVKVVGERMAGYQDRMVA